MLFTFILEGCGGVAGCGIHRLLVCGKVQYSPNEGTVMNTIQWSIGTAFILGGGGGGQPLLDVDYLAGADPQRARLGS